ncbi:hypothetical protein [Candidatus Bealeia paramacronuclearis]|uniref:hypothetical protein n=1 Tax=Candidatus Bealeia paramacronuclearis TaxID=1921001 RepID=UPI002F263E70
MPEMVQMAAVARWSHHGNARMRHRINRYQECYYESGSGCSRGKDMKPLRDSTRWSKRFFVNKNQVDQVDSTGTGNGLPLLG